MTNFVIIYFMIILIICTKSSDEDPNEIAPKEGVDYPGIKCGKKNPQKPKDCTKYGTDSKMLCCWINDSQYNYDGGECQLLSEAMAKQKNITGSRDFVYGEKKYWECGNKSYYLYNKYKLFILFFVLYYTFIIIVF